MSEALKLVNFLPLEWDEATARLGALVGGRVIDVAALCDEQERGCGCAGSVVDLLSCPECLAAVREAIAEAGPGAPGLALAQARLLAPVPLPGKLLCLAGNYAAHIQEGRGKEAGVQSSDMATPRVFLKPSTHTVRAPGEPITVARTSSFVDYEGELAVIIGKQGKYIKAEDALDYVGGVTCLNDISERSLHIWDRPEQRPWDGFFDWLNGKWFDSFAPMGPCAVPLSDVGDPGTLDLLTRVNGEVVQQASTAELIFSVPRLIEYISQMVTLDPGDVIATGTPAGVGKARGVALKPGDVVEVEISGIGVLSNPVVAE